MHRAPDRSGQFNESHFDRVREVVHRSLHGQTRVEYLDEDDLVTEVAEHVAERLHRFEQRGSASMNTWIETVAKNKLRDIIERHRAGKRGGLWQLVSLSSDPSGDALTVEETTAAPGRSVEAEAEARVLGADLAAWIPTLSREHQRTLEAFAGGPSPRAAARALGIAPASFYGRLATIRRIAEDANLDRWL